MNIIKPPYEDPLFRFAKQESLKHIIVTFSKFSKSGNFNTTTFQLAYIPIGCL